MKIAFVVIAIVILVILGVIITGLIKDHLDEKARKKEYQDMLGKQKREAEWRSEINTYRKNTTTSFASGGSIAPRPAVTKKLTKRTPVKREEDDTYVMADSVDMSDGFWLDTPNTDTISGWTSTSDDNSSGWSSSNDSSSSNNSSDYSSNSGSDYGSSSSSDSSSSGSSDSGSSSSSDW